MCLDIKFVLLFRLIGDRRIMCLYGLRVCESIVIKFYSINRFILMYIFGRRCLMNVLGDSLNPGDVGLYTHEC